MFWVMLWAHNFVIYQVEFESEALCEAARSELMQSHEILRKAVACVQIREGK